MDSTWTVKLTVRSYDDGCRRMWCALEVEDGTLRTEAKLPLGTTPGDALDDAVKAMRWWLDDFLSQQLEMFQGPDHQVTEG